MLYLKMNSKTRRQYFFLIGLFACGLSTNLMWCNFIGHSGGFSASAFEFSHLVNVRVFWLAGISLSCLLLILFPGKIRHFDRGFKFILPLIASFGTGFFALAYNQSLFDPVVLTVGGLTLAGATYAWISAKYNLLILRVLGVQAVAWSTAGALSIMLLASALTPLISQVWVLVAIAMLLPLLAVTLFEISRNYLMCSAFNNDKKAQSPLSLKKVFGLNPAVQVPSRDSAKKTSYYILLVAVAFMLAMVRSLGAYGVWQGTEVEVTSSFAFSLPSVVVMIVFLCLFVYFAITKMEKHSIGVRFLLPIIVIFAGLFIALAQINASHFSPQIYNYSLLEADSCSHLLFWCIVGVSMERLSVPSFRIIGIAGLMYGLVSIVWVILLGNTDLVDSSFVAIMTYGLLVIVLSGIWMLLKQNEKSFLGEIGLSAKGSSVRSGEDLQGESPTEILVARCDVMAAEYRLSPREKDIFILLAQGRTRKFISDELVLSDNTIKTHLSHIYLKMDISDRQQMLSLLWGSANSPQD